jgi:2-C-methyl-D-erythritol 4-phosphate cytidylyltransferase / 2-C-methyl-D-erythritol 2,4-cyclodiphosphate synthase
VAPPAADAVIVAAGASTRMGGIDKITALVGGRPLLAWALNVFDAAPSVGHLVVVAPAGRVEDLRRADWIPDDVTIVAGGVRRQDSVAAGVRELERRGGTEDRVVLVHDGARPCVRPELIERVVEAATASGAAIPVVPVVETLKRVAGDLVAETVDRSGLAAAQTPQGIRFDVLQAAYARFPADGPETFTDEAALLEACTIPIRVVPGHVDNLKVTVAADLGRAASLLGVAGRRVGFGEDSHPFGPEMPLVLGGVVFDGVARLAGHSDGDVVLHAIADALLGAAGLGDLGRLFPADHRTPRGVSSAELLETVRSTVGAAGWAIGYLDVTIVGLRPRLGSRLHDVRTRVAQLLDVTIEQVNVKASTGNLFGPEGAGRGISARAVATLEPRW